MRKESIEMYHVCDYPYYSFGHLLVRVQSVIIQHCKLATWHRETRCRDAQCWKWNAKHAELHLKFVLMFTQCIIHRCTCADKVWQLVVCVCLLPVYLLPGWNSAPGVCFYVCNNIVWWILICQIFETKLCHGVMEGPQRLLLLIKTLPKTNLLTVDRFTTR